MLSGAGGDPLLGAVGLCWWREPGVGLLCPPGLGGLLLLLPPRQKPAVPGPYCSIEVNLLAVPGGKQHPGLLACRLGMTSLT